MGEMRVRVRVKPGSRAARSVVEGPDGVLLVTVRERAIEGAANAAVVAALAEHFGVPRRDVRVVAGATARIKTIAIATA
jgi:uncharacterized protein